MAYPCDHKRVCHGKRLFIFPSRSAINRIMGQGRAKEKKRSGSHTACDCKENLGLELFCNMQRGGKEDDAAKTVAE